MMAALVCQSIAVVQAEISQQLLDRLPLNYEEVVMPLTGRIVITSPLAPSGQNLKLSNILLYNQICTQPPLYIVYYLANITF